MIMLTVAGRKRGMAFEPATLKGRDRRHPCWTQDRTRTGPPARDSVRRTTRTWTDSAMTTECLGTSEPPCGSNQKGDWRDPGAYGNTPAGGQRQDGGTLLAIAGDGHLCAY